VVKIDHLEFRIVYLVLIELQEKKGEDCKMMHLRPLFTFFLAEK